MRLQVNGQEKVFDDLSSAGDLLTQLEISRERVAVVVNEEVVRRAELDAKQLHDGDTVEIITMVGGG